MSEIDNRREFQTTFDTNVALNQDFVSADFLLAELAQRLLLDCLVDLQKPGLRNEGFPYDEFLHFLLILKDGLLHVLPQELRKYTFPAFIELLDLYGRDFVADCLEKFDVTIRRCPVAPYRLDPLAIEDFPSQSRYLSHSRVVLSQNPTFLQLLGYYAELKSYLSLEPSS